MRGCVLRLYDYFSLWCSLASVSIDLSASRSELTLGFHTTTYTAILYASSSLQMAPAKIIIIGILVQLSAVFSSLLTPRLQRQKSWSNMDTLFRIVILALILPVYTCFGLLLPFGGLRTSAEMYVAATWFGLVSDSSLLFWLITYCVHFRALPLLATMPRRTKVKADDSSMALSIVIPEPFTQSSPLR